MRAIHESADKRANARQQQRSSHFRGREDITVLSAEDREDTERGPQADACSEQSAIGNAVPQPHGSDLGTRERLELPVRCERKRVRVDCGQLARDLAARGVDDENRLVRRHDASQVFERSSCRLSFSGRRPERHRRQQADPSCA
jgi:hypothetical protein